MKTIHFKKLILLYFFILGLSSCKISRFFIYNFADIKDHKRFPNRKLNEGRLGSRFYLTNYKISPQVSSNNNKKVSVDDFLKSSKTVAYLVLKNDSILDEKYYYGYNETSIVPSFSMAKSITSILIGCAIDDGFIKSADEPITNYIPELSKNGFEKVTIKHLLQMTSGIFFNESYVNPFGDAASIYYGTNLRKIIGKLKLEDEPGTKFHYKSGDTQLLGWVLERSLKTKTITEYLEEKIWNPLQMDPASWSIDRKKSGLEKTFCCINANALDYAKIGSLYLNMGVYKGKQIVSEKWVKESTKIDTTEGSTWYYQYQWWLPNKEGDFMAHGILGQYIYVCPSKNIVIVRLGKKEGTQDWKQFFKEIADFY